MTDPKKEADRLVEEVLNHAQETQALNKCLQKYMPEFEDVYKLLKNPDWLQDKEIALRICHMLTKTCLESKQIDEGSISHLMGLRLYDYIERMGQLKDS